MVLKHSRTLSYLVSVLCGGSVSVQDYSKMLKYLLILGLALGAPPARSNNTPKRRTVTNDDGTTTEVALYNNKTVRAGIGGFCEYDVNHVRFPN